MTTATKPSQNSPLGRDTSRIDGPLKVTGSAVYTSDQNFPGMLYAVPVGSTISHGTIAKLDTSAAEKMPGVKAVYHRANLGKLFRVVPNDDFSAYSDEERPPFEDDIIRYYGQYVALIVADTFEQATAAADAVEVTYNEKKPNVSHKLTADDGDKVESHRGDAEKAYGQAAFKHEATYTTPAETHSVIELHASVAVFNDPDFTLYETTQGVVNHRNVLAEVLGVEPEQVRVISKFLGSGFGGKITPWPHCALAAAAARNLRKPVKLVLSRKATFHAAGHRPITQQRIRLGADADGKLVSLQHDYLSHTSLVGDYKENCGECTSYLYRCPNLKVASALSRRNVGTPTSMRGPGAVPGLFALESAMDELAVKLKMDPIQLRLLNEPKEDEGLKIPFASRHIVDCYKTGAEKFGWDKRNPTVGSMNRDGLTLGWGVAGASWIAERFAADVSVELCDDGRARIISCTQDIGTGTYTVMAQLIADKFGLPIEKIEVVLGDSSLPAGPMSGGSMGVASLIPAVGQAVDKVKQALLAIASKTPESPFNGVDAKELVYSNGMVHKKDQTESAGVRFEKLLQQGNYKIVSRKGSSPSTFGAKAKVSKHSYGVHFVEVTWQEEIARLRVNRVVTVIDAGKIINPKSGRNQIEGAVVMGMGMALFEATHYEPTRGAPLNSNLAGYMLAVNADVPKLEVHFLDFPNTDLNEYGARGIGEIGLAGFAAATANAVYHATGVRVRDLPIRIEDLLV